MMRRYTDYLVDDIERRQTSTTNPNITAWETQTTSACTTALTMLNGTASNPSGMAFCYNLPFLDNSTGIFQADLRLFMISSPSGDFAGIPSSSIQVGVAYVGATVSTINPSDLSPSGSNSPSKRNEEGKEKRQAMAPMQSQSYAFVGQINKNLVTANLNSSALQAILIPIVSLTAKEENGTIVNTTLSSDEATFVTGIFSDQPKTMATAANASAVVAAVPFVLPGTHILIFPIGAIITGIWAFLGIATVAYGTVGRMGFRENYRRRLARAQKGNLARI